MQKKTRAILQELIDHGHKFTGYTVQEVREALTDALEQPDIVQCKDCKFQYTDDCPEVDMCFSPPDEYYCKFGEEKDGR